jgi:site-specific DNA recombinase
MKSDNQIQEPMNVALYARVSTGRQENEQTIESQLDEVKRKIAEDGNTLLPQNIFIDDGWSGELLARPSLDNLRDAAKENSFEAVYVYDRGRLSRTFFHQELVISELIDLGIQFISLHDVKATTPEEKVLQSMQGVFHEYERIKIAERMRRGKMYHAKEGKIINGRALYGYTYKKREDDNVDYLINEDEAGVVRKIWNWFGNDNSTVHTIQRRLFDLKIMPQKGKSDFWSKSVITRLLKQETYVTGKAFYNKSEAVVAKHPMNNGKYKKVKKSSRKVKSREDWIPFDVPRIITDYSLYEKVQKKLEYNRVYANKKSKYDYLLSSLIYCGCGNKRVGDGCSKNGHFYYRCIDRIRSGVYERKCKSSGINAAILDGLLWKELRKKLFSYPMMRKYAEKWIKSVSVLSSEDLLEKCRLNEMIVKTTEEENRYSKAYGVGTLEFDQFQNLMKDAKKRRVSYQKQLSELANKSAEVNVQIEVDELLDEVMNVVNNIDFADKFRVIRDIIDKVIVSERSGAEVWAHLPLPITITEKLGYEPERRDCWFAQCWKVDSF